MHLIKMREGGRITIPVAIRQQLGLVPGTKLVLDFDKDSITLTSEGLLQIP